MILQSQPSTENIRAVAEIERDSVRRISAWSSARSEQLAVDRQRIVVLERTDNGRISVQDGRDSDVEA